LRKAILPPPRPCRSSEDVPVPSGVIKRTHASPLQLFRLGCDRPPRDSDTQAQAAYGGRVPEDTGGSGKLRKS
jgi:hypothetical protein